LLTIIIIVGRRMVPIKIRPMAPVFMLIHVVAVVLVTIAAAVIAALANAVIIVVIRHLSNLLLQPYIFFNGRLQTVAPA
jgi:hypothetical protein